MKNKLISIIGLGYIGLPTAALLADNGFKVLGIDICEDTVNLINQGKVHIDEPELDKLVNSTVTSGKLKASISYQESDVYIICVPTPFNKKGSIPKPNINHVIDATHSIAPFLKPGNIIILESTSPVGTTEKIKTILKKYKIKDDEIYIAYCPERVLPGKIVIELINNDRIVGGLTADSTRVVANFYKSFVNGNVLETDAKTAEMCKLTENSFRDVNIAFANEISMICNKESINTWDMIKLANHHPRVNILEPSTGVGGHCIAIDPWFIVSNNLKEANLIRTAREVNLDKTKWVIDKIKFAVKDISVTTKKNPVIACLGLSFKPNVGDLRESPALKVAKSLVSLGYELISVEPNIKTYKGLKLVNIEEAIRRADIIAVLVKHNDFINHKIQKRLSKMYTLDFCGALQVFKA